MSDCTGRAVNSQSMRCANGLDFSSKKQNGLDVYGGIIEASQKGLESAAAMSFVQTTRRSRDCKK